jgi:acyl carrier protein
MEELIAKLTEILEVDELDATKKFTDYDEWDSLCSLSILAMLDSDYHKTMKAADIRGFASIEDFCKAVLS